MKVLITRAIPDAGPDLLRSHSIEMRVLGNVAATRSQLLRALQSDAYDGMVTMLTDQVDEELLSRVGSDMKVIANYAVGHNNISVDEARKRGIVVTNTPGVLTNTVAEHAFALILAVATRIVESDDFVRANKFSGWEPELFLGLDLRDKTLGIIGAGRIGAQVAVLGSGFGMRIVYHDVQRNADLESRVSADFFVGPDDLLRQADVVSLHLPLTPTTRHFLNARRLSLMKPTAILVNTSRGPVIDEAALISVLQNGGIFGAGLDVFEHEPKVPRALRGLPNVILTPHTASASVATRTRMSEIVAENIVSVLHGGDAPNAVA